MPNNRTPTIVGAALSDYPKAPHLSERQHHAQALTRALDSAGLKIKDIDGYMAASMGHIFIGTWGTPPSDSSWV